MIDRSCRDCRYQHFKPVTGPAGDKQSQAMCGLHNVPSDYARMIWFRDRSNTIVSEENCGPEARFFVARAV